MAQAPAKSKGRPTMLDKLKDYVSPNSTAGTLRDRKKTLDKEIDRQTSSATPRKKSKLA